MLVFQLKKIWNTFWESVDLYFEILQFPVTWLSAPQVNQLQALKLRKRLPIPWTIYDFNYGFPYISKKNTPYIKSHWIWFLLKVTVITNFLSFACDVENPFVLKLFQSVFFSLQMTAKRFKRCNPCRPTFSIEAFLVHVWWTSKIFESKSLISLF